MARVSRRRAQTPFHERAVRVQAELRRGARTLSEGRPHAAIRTYQRVLRLRPSHTEALHGLGLAHLQLGALRDAVDWIAAAHRSRPNDDEILRNLGILLLKLSRFERALDCFEALVERSPGCPRTMGLLGQTLALLGRHADASRWLEGAEHADPQNPDRQVLLLQTRAALWNWENYEEDRQRLTATVWEALERGQSPPCPPFGAVMLGLSEETITALTHAQAASRAFLRRRPGAHTPRKPLRIGYLSPDFGNHPVGLLMAPILESHDRSQFEVRAYALRSAHDPVRDRIEAAVTETIRLDDWDDTDIVEKIRADHLDLLVDLAGFTGGARPGVLRQRPAPLQVHFLGYPGSLPRSLVDYQVLHASQLGPRGTAAYDERLAILPETFIASQGFEKPTATPSRKDLGIPEDTFVFGFFGAPYRVEPKVFSAWMRILAEVPRSVLWVQNGHREARDNLRGEAVRQGISAERLMFSDWGLLTESWAHTHADLWLDGWHVTSGTASIIAIWTHTPILTLAGPTPQSRTGAAVLAGARLPELVAESPTDYMERAISFARHPDSLTAVVEKIRATRSEMPLFQVERFTRHLEDAFCQMANRAETGLGPETLRVAPRAPIPDEA